MTSSISQGLNASAVAYAHRLGAIDVGQRQATLAMACTHQTWHMRIWQTTSANGMQHSAKAYTHQPWRVRIDWASLVVAWVHRPTTGEIG